MKDLSAIGIAVEMLDLRDYFGKKDLLKKKISSLGGVWVRGGNTFILRRAMKLSGFDEIIKEIKKEDFLYSGDSAGICILAPSLKGLQNCDDPDVNPYSTEIKGTIWEGLGILDYLILPHYKSDHPESVFIDEEIKFCKKNKIKFRKLKDGEVIII